MTASARGIAPRPHRVAMLELNDRLAKQQAMRAKFGRTLDRSGPIVGDGRGLKLGRYRKLSCGAFCGMRGGFGRQLSSSHRFSVAGSRGCGARLSGRRCVPRLVRTRLRELWILLGCRGLFRDSSVPPSTLGFRRSASPCFPCQVDVSRTPGWRVSECGFRSRTTRKMAKSCPRVVPSHLHHPEGQVAHPFARLRVRGRAPCVRSPSRGCSQPLQGLP